MPDVVAKHSLMDGKLHVFQRERSGFWQCGTFLAGKYRRASTKTDSLAQAKDVARDWYLTLHGKLRQGEIKDEKTFKDAAAVFEREYEIITEGQRSARYVKTQSDRLRIHLIPYFGHMALSDIRPGTVQEYRVHRTTSGVHWKTGKPLGRPSRSTLHQEIVALRQVLKTAVRSGWLEHVPDLSPPYKTSGKISHRAWFSPDEYRQFYRATRARKDKLKGTQWQWSGEQLHDYQYGLFNNMNAFNNVDCRRRPIGPPADGIAAHFSFDAAFVAPMIAGRQALLEDFLDDGPMQRSSLQRGERSRTRRSSGA